MAKLEKSAGRKPAPSFQDLILRLERYWADYGCVIVQPYNSEVGAGTLQPPTPSCARWAPSPGGWPTSSRSKRPKDGRYGENPNRVHQFLQYQVILKPIPPDSQGLYLESLRAIGIEAEEHDIRFVEDDWEIARRSAPRAWAGRSGCDGMEVSQFTYFQQVGGVRCAAGVGRADLRPAAPVHVCAGRRATSIDLNFNGGEGDDKVTYGDVFLQAEQEYSPLQFRARRHRDAVRAFPRSPKPNAKIGLLAKRREGQAPSHGAARL